MISAKDAVDYQAQSDQLKVQAREEINVVSANAHIDWAAAKSISLSTAGGANITIAGGNITVQCPGKILVHAGMKKFYGAGEANVRDACTAAQHLRGMPEKIPRRRTCIHTGGMTC